MSDEKVREWMSPFKDSFIQRDLDGTHGQSNLRADQILWQGTMTFYHHIQAPSDYHAFKDVSGWSAPRPRRRCSSDRFIKFANQVADFIEDGFKSRC